MGTGRSIRARLILQQFFLKRLGGAARWASAVQQPRSGLAMMPTGGAKLVEDARLVRTTGTLIAAVDAGQ